VHRFLPLLALIAACSLGGEPPDENSTKPAQGFATQASAPSPAYRALLDLPAPFGGEWGQRQATTAPPHNAKAIGDLWIRRLESRGALLGYGLAGKGSDGPVDPIDTGLTEAEFDSWVSENGWRVPGHIRWSFVPEMKLPPVSDSARNGIRVWPASTRRTGLQHQTLFHGRVELRVGCFFVGLFDEPVDKLAWFHAEVGLDMDEAGYFIFRDRRSGQILARLGEEMNWGGPASADVDKQAESALRQACGSGEVYVVGTPESKERFVTQYPHLRNPGNPPPPAKSGRKKSD
jgi:hypothetical protein